MLSFLKKFFQTGNNAAEEALTKGAVIVDVRTPSEFKQGHINGSKNIPLNEIKLKTEIIRGWNKPVVTVCRSGMAKSLLQAAGIEVYNGGAWTNLKTK